MPAKVVMTGEEMRRSLARMAHEIVERNRSIENIMLVGMRTRGFPLAKRLAANIATFEKVNVPVGALGSWPRSKARLRCVRRYLAGER